MSEKQELKSLHTLEQAWRRHINTQILRRLRLLAIKLFTLAVLEVAEVANNFRTCDMLT